MLWSGSGLCCTLRWWQLNLLASHPCVKQLNQNTSKSVSNHFLSESKDLLSSQRNDLCLESSCCIWLRSTSLQSRGREGNKYERPLCGYHLKDRLFQYPAEAMSLSILLAPALLSWLFMQLTVRRNTFWFSESLSCSSPVCFSLFPVPSTCWQRAVNLFICAFCLCTLTVSCKAPLTAL